MGNTLGNTLERKQETRENVTEKAKAECAFTEKLYDLLMAYQNRLQDTKRKPLRESERVGELSLPLSRLYNEIWGEALELKKTKTEPKKKDQRQMKEAA